ncbi:hypothetical protein LINGRAHAP2_LOCUS24721 [Linum grandiflorum]
MGTHTPPRSAIRPRKELASGWGPSIPPSKLPRPTTMSSSTSAAAELSSIFPWKPVGTIRILIPDCWLTTIPVAVGRGRLGKSIAQVGKRRRRLKLIRCRRRR